MMRYLLTRGLAHLGGGRGAFGLDHALELEDSRVLRVDLQVGCHAHVHLVRARRGSLVRVGRLGLGLGLGVGIG